MPELSVEEKIALAKQQLHNEGNQLVDKAQIGPMSGLTKFMAPSNAVAVTSPFTGSVQYNPNMMKDRSQLDINSDLEHELAHVKQSSNLSFMDKAMHGLKQFLPQPAYDQRGDEMEAFQAEKDRALKFGYPQQGDINLPRPKR